MRATGIIRRVDDLGRIVIPKEIRRTLRINENDALELFVMDNGICYKKYVPYGQLNYSLICNALVGCGRPFAVYDDLSLIRAVGMSGGDGSVPRHWRNAKEVFHDNENTIIPIVVEDAIFGFVVLDSDVLLDYARGVIDAAIAAM